MSRLSVSRQESIVRHKGNGHVSAINVRALRASQYIVMWTAITEYYLILAMRESILHGSSSKGTWVLSKTEAMHIAINGHYLREQGLVSLEELWKKFAPKWRTA